MVPFSGAILLGALSNAPSIRARASARTARSNTPQSTRLDSWKRHPQKMCPLRKNLSSTEKYALSPQSRQRLRANLRSADFDEFSPPEPGAAPNISSFVTTVDKTHLALSCDITEFLVFSRLVGRRGVTTRRSFVHENRSSNIVTERWMRDSRVARFPATCRPDVAWPCAHRPVLVSCCVNFE